MVDSKVLIDINICTIHPHIQSIQLKNELVYKKVMLCDLVIKIIGFFKDLRCSGCVTEKELKYFSYEYKKITNLGKLYLLPKIHKKLKNVPGRPLVSNCATPTEKVSEFLDYHHTHVFSWIKLKLNF